MSELDKAISELVSAFQEIMAKPETDQERSTIANLQSQIRDLTETVQRKNREILALKKRASEQRVAILNLQETVAELRERNAKILSESKAKELCVNHEPAQMTTPLGMLPINSQGMRRLADAYAQINRRTSALQKENDAYEALFRVLAETLREYDPKVKS